MGLGSSSSPFFSPCGTSMRSAPPPSDASNSLSRGPLPPLRSLRRGSPSGSRSRIVSTGMGSSSGSSSLATASAIMASMADILTESEPSSSSSSGSMRMSFAAVCSCRRRWISTSVDTSGMALARPNMKPSTKYWNRMKVQRRPGTVHSMFHTSSKVKVIRPAFVITARTVMTSKTVCHVPMSSAGRGMGRWKTFSSFSASKRYST
mmetsp:Transcript_35018/g.110140  ORF Transcript_35018/g.110140 Transcript_35018/m.110140 type:complete len:206 (+) Transcript_35018:1796-2413(+)